MSISLQTNVNSLIAQQNLSVTNKFQSQTIAQLTSGYRINSSGDDAAGLAVANKFRSGVAELTQGVANGNDAVAQLQIMDGGMNNISMILDRLKTLATQSASGTFTGNRTTLNTEFQQDLTEIDRQATSIGLNTGGTFAKSLNVYLGAGSGSGTGAAAVGNATVTANLTQATVDSQSLGMKGLQAVGGTTDIGANSGTSVQNIVGDLTNSGSEATPGSADFYFVGPGFSDASKVKVSVNLSGVNDTAGLVTALNTAIAAAGTGTSQAGSAFQSANIVASAHTDLNGGTELAFTSSTSAFQVESGDRMANALLGNFTGPGSTTGAVIQTSVTGETTAIGTAAFVPTNKTVQISGAGLSTPVKLTFSANDATVSDAITDLNNQVSQNAALKTAGISVSGTAGNPLVFTSARGESFSVMSTGDATNQLGMGSFVTNASASNAVDYKSITGASYDYGSASTANNNQATMQFSINGAAATPLSLNLAGGDAVAAARTTTAIANPAITASTASSTIGITALASHDWSAANETFGVNVNGAGVQNITLSLNYTNGAGDAALLAQINSQLSGATASISTNHLLITANAAGTTGSVVLSGSTSHVGNTFTQTAATDGNDMLNFSVDGVKVSTQLSGSAAATITGAGTPFAAAGTVVITAASSGAAAGTVLTPPTALTLYNAVTFTAQVNSGPNQTITLAAGTYNNNNTADAASYVHAINAQLVGAVASEASGVITITSNTTGVTSDVKITDGLGTDAQVTSSASVVAHDFSGGGGSTGTFTVLTGGGSQTVSLTRHDFTAADYVNDINYNNGTPLANGVKAIVDPADATKIEMVSGDAAGSTSAITLTDGTNTPLATNLNLGVVIAHGDDSALTTLQLGAQTGVDNRGLAGNNQFLVSSDVATETGPALVSIGAGTYNAAGIVATMDLALNNAGLNNGAVTPTTGVIASVSAAGSLVLSSSTVGALSSLSISAPPSGLNTALGVGGGTLGLTAQTHVGGSATAASLESTIQTAINNAVASDVSGNAGATVTVNNGGSLTITDNNKGAGHSISAFTGTAAVSFLGNGSAGAVAGLNRSGTDMAAYLNQQFSSVGALQPAQLQAVWTPGISTAGTLQVLSGNNTSFRINSGSTGTATTATTTTNLSGGTDFTGLNSQAFQISTDGGTSFKNILLNTNTTGSGVTGANSVVSAINNALTAAGVAAKATLVTADPTHFYVQLASNATGSGASIQLQGPATGTASALATGKILDGVGTAETTADANLGFGVSGASFTAAALTAGSASSNLTSAAPLNHIIDAGGASSANVTVSSVTNSLSFSALQFGNDKQAITIAANALDGSQQSTTITLKNLASLLPTDNRAGANIDTAISFINAQLQQSNNPTLQKIVAVKENNSGDQINFISSLSSFNVSVSSTANTGDGVNGGTSESVKVGVIGAGSNLAIDTQAGAEAAVTAISAAVGKLGSAQASIGIGENQLGYAISLANSQITNFSSAESQIRDANVAEQAANLSKAQVLSQASIAAMAQANSATQGVLALLRG